ncbi:unnamed protein product [Ectocarpus sp. CCAP 1310/34]|nr:unnamed protein product [Ectocarpus sp. CCAP 1310/34]
MIPAPFVDAHMQLDKRKSLNTIVLAMAVLTICFFICACVVSSNANAGFNVVLTAMMYVAYVGLLAVVFNRKRATDGGMDTAMAIEPIVGGGLIGITTMMCFLSLMTAVYWGQMSGCEDDTDDVDGYSCYNSFGMAAVAWFASFLLISEAVTLAALILWKEDIFFVDGGYDNFDAQEDRGAYSSSAYAYDGATFGTGGIGGGLGGGGGVGGNGDDDGAPQQADL